MGSYRPVQAGRLTLGDGKCRICIPLMGSDERQLKEQMEQILPCAPDLIEWRVDAYRDCQDMGKVMGALCSIREMAGETPLLFTFRTLEEGGEAPADDELYAALAITAAGSGKVELIDLELHRGEALLRPLVERIRQEGAKVIVSCHDFEKTPPREEMNRLFCSMQQLGGDITKLAVMPSSRRDVLALLEASVDLEEGLADRPFIAISMGSLGTISRMAAQFTGSALTFASAGKSSAPGQASAGGMRTALQMLNRM